MLQKTFLLSYKHVLRKSFKENVLVLKQVAGKEITVLDYVRH